MPLWPVADIPRHLGPGRLHLALSWMPPFDSWVYLRMNKNDRGWFALIVVVHYLAGISLFYLIAWWAYAIWLALGVPIGYLAAKFFKRRHKQTLIEEWRSTHPDLSDYWLPKDLRDVA